MKKEKQCPLCNEQVYSGIGKGCKMCGTPLSNLDEEFCSEVCMIKYFKINTIVTKGGLTV